MKRVSLIVAGLLLAACAATPSESTTPAPPPTAEGFAKEKFPRVDFNGDGLLTPYEFKEYQKAMFAKHYDTDGDGVLKIGCASEDFSERLTKFGSQHPSLIECYSLEGVTPVEFTFDDYFAVHSGWLSSADLDGDGFVTEDEFVTAYSAP